MHYTYIHIISIYIYIYIYIYISTYRHIHRGIDIIEGCKGKRMEGRGRRMWMWHPHRGGGGGASTGKVVDEYENRSNTLRSDRQLLKVS
jgi:hypothetical protein